MDDRRRYTFLVRAMVFIRDKSGHITERLPEQRHTTVFGYHKALANRNVTARLADEYGSRGSVSVVVQDTTAVDVHEVIPQLALPLHTLEPGAHVMRVGSIGRKERRW